MLIGLCGKPNSGKSEVAHILQYAYGFNEINTKRPLALACHELTGIPHANFLTQDGKAQLYHGKSLREIMGNVQKTMETMFGIDHTINVALEQQYYPEKGDYVLDSLRMTQGVNFEGFVVEVLSEKGIHTGLDFDQYDKDCIDYSIMNTGSLSSLEAEIEEMLATLRELRC